MVINVVGLFLLALGLVTLALQRFYSAVPAKELKRLAAKGDQLAEILYRAVASGASLRLLLWIVIGLSLSGGLMLGISNLAPLAALGLVAIVLASIVFLQSVRLTVQSAKLAAWAAPSLSWLLAYLHRPLSIVARAVNGLRHQEAHSGLYEKEDFLALLGQQKEQVDNRIALHDLELLERAAQFDDRQAADIALPMSRAKLVKIDDHIGPVLLGELHSSGQDSFLVYDGSRDHVVGTLFLRDAAAAKEGGLVRDLLHPRLSFVHEDFTLRQVLKAFAHTGQFMVVVVNAFEEPVGLISLSYLLAQLVGERADDDFEAFDNRTAVAAYRPKQPELATEEVVVEDETPSSDETGVVESDQQ